MELVGGIFGLAVLLGIAWLISSAKDATSKAVSQKVLFRGSHREGQAEIHTVTTFDAATTIDAVIAAVRAWGLATEPSGALGGALYLESVAVDGIVFASGNRIWTSYRSALVVDAGGDRVHGQYRLLQWTETDGILGDIEQMQILRTRLRRTVADLDPAAGFSDEQTQ